MKCIRKEKKNRKDKKDQFKFDRVQLEKERTAHTEPCESHSTNLMIVRRFTVAFFQIFTKGLIELFAEIGSAWQGKSQSQEKAIKYTGLAFTCTQ